MKMNKEDITFWICMIIIFLCSMILWTIGIDKIVGIIWK